MSSKPVANPYATAGGGSIFEARIYASFIVKMLVCERYGIAALPFAPIGRVDTIRLQAQSDGYRTDDCVITVTSTDVHKLLIQVKTQMTYSAKDPEFTDYYSAYGRCYSSCF